MPELAPLGDTELLSWLRLWRSENVGPITFRQLLHRFGSGKAALAGLPELARRGGRERPLSICPLAAAEREIADLWRLGGRFIAISEPSYPAALAEIDDAPPLLSLLGDERLLERRAIAVVGSRNASANGRLLAKSLARDLGQRGWVVVSGLARGIDSAAHAGALETGTVAVLAGGIDRPYPPESERLYHEVARRGLLVSEMPFGRIPQARHFPRRNRIVSGLALGTVVVEAAFNPARRQEKPSIHARLSKRVPVYPQLYPLGLTDPPRRHSILQLLDSPRRIRRHSASHEQRTVGSEEPHHSPGHVIDGAIWPKR